MNRHFDQRDAYMEVEGRVCMDVVNADIAGANICPYSRPAGRDNIVS